jgi:protein MpaA
MRSPFVVTLVLLAPILTGCSTSRPVAAAGGAISPAGDEAAAGPANPAPPASRSASTLARSREGQPIEHRTLGSGPTTVLLIGLIHGSEPEGHARFDELWSALDTPEVRRAATIHAIPSMNPDGHATRSRYNARGVDLNRNWPASNFSPSRRRGPSPLSEPETRAVHGLLESVRPDLLVVFHSTGNGPFVDPDGPALGAAVAFADAASAIDPRWRPLPDYTNPPGSLGTYAGLDLGIPTLTVEFDRGQAPDAAMRSALAGLRAAIERAADGADAM